MGPTWPPLTAPLHILMTVIYAVRCALPASRSAETYQSILEMSENSQHDFNFSRSEAGKVALTK